MNLGKMCMLLLSYLSHGTVGIMIAFNITDYIRLLLPIKKHIPSNNLCDFTVHGEKDKDLLYTWNCITKNIFRHALTYSWAQNLIDRFIYF